MLWARRSWRFRPLSLVSLRACLAETMRSSANASIARIGHAALLRRQRKVALGQRLAVKHLDHRIHGAGLVILMGKLQLNGHAGFPLVSVTLARKRMASRSISARSSASVGSTVR